MVNLHEEKKVTIRSVLSIPSREHILCQFVICPAAIRAHDRGLPGNQHGRLDVNGGIQGDWSDSKDYFFAYTSKVDYIYLG